MYYYLYQITNKINNKIYIGVHRTVELNDDYFGSGLMLKRAILKYGKENFEKIILEHFNNIEDMYNKEAEIVNLSFIKRKDTYNITEGGKIENTIEAKRMGGIVGGNKVKEKKIGIFNEELRKKYSEENLKKQKENNIGFYNKEVGLLARKEAQSPKAKEKRKETFKKINHQQEEKNSCFGTCWIYNESIKESKKIKKEDLEKYILGGWIKGRKMYF